MTSERLLLFLLFSSPVDNGHRDAANGIYFHLVPEVVELRVISHPGQPPPGAGMQLGALGPVGWPLGRHSGRAVGTEMVRDAKGLLQPRAPFAVSYKMGCKALISMVTSSLQHTNTPALGSVIFSHRDPRPPFSAMPSAKHWVMHGKWHLPNAISQLFCQEEPMKANQWARRPPSAGPDLHN